MSVAGVFFFVARPSRPDVGAKLKYVDLSFNIAVDGDLEAFADLVQLEDLRLNSTCVEGAFTSLAKLVELRRLDLERTRVRGPLDSLKHCAKLEYGSGVFFPSPARVARARE